MTKTMVRVLATALALTALTACDRARRIEDKAERSDQDYRTAMADYSAGRLEQAAAGFEKVLRENPSNGSARFQLACLMQDRLGDPLGALCNFREFAFQEPDSDKAPLARDRMAMVEAQLAKKLARKHNLVDNAALARENARVEGEVHKAAEQVAALEERLKDAEQALKSLGEENARLRQQLSKIGDEPEETRRMSIADVRSLLDDVEEDRLRVTDEVRSLLEEEPDPAPAKSALVTDNVTAAPPADGKPAKPLVASREGGAPAPEPLHEEKPETYVVGEGDTLYRIALRFYGKTSAWVKIRDANKAVISTDGRIRVGQELRLP